VDLMGFISCTPYVPGGAASSHSFNVPLTAVAGRKLVFVFTEETTQTISALTFNGVSFLANLRVGITHSSGTLGEQLYDYEIPDNLGAGDYALAFTLTGSTASVSGYAYVADGLVSGAPEATNSAEGAASGTLATSVTATAGAFLVAGGVNAAATSTYSWSGNVTERVESDEAGYTSSVADGTATSGSMTATSTSSASQNKVIVLASYAAVVGPTITVQPANDVGIISNGQSTVYTATATGTNVDAPTWSEDGTPISDGGIYDIVTTGAGTSSCTSTLTITRTVKTGTPFDIKANFADDNGNTDTNTVTDTWWTGPVLTTFPATDGDGESTAQLTSDFRTADYPGTAIEVRIPLADGDVAVTVTTT
jgi:hypothetical protein